MVVVPASHGWLWVKQGAALFGKAPLTWLLVSIAYWMVMTVLARLPYIGLLAGSLVTPALAVSFLAMCRELDRGERLKVTLFAAGFRRNLATLVTLGGLYLAVTLAIFAATWLIDGGTLMQWMLLGKPAASPLGENETFLTAVLVAILCWIPVQLAFWFAPVLAAWHDMSAVKALFFSFFAALRNWTAFVVCALVAGAASGLVAAALFNLQRVKPAVAVVPTLIFLLLIVVIPLYYASLYASYRDVFPERTPES